MPDHRRKLPIPVIFEPHPSLFEPIRRDLLALKACVQALRLREELKYSPDQPRWPEGHPLGGQWRPKEAGEGEGEALESTGSIGDLAANDGTPGNNQAQNKQVNDVVRILGLTKDERRQLHLEISGQNLGFHEILRIGREIKGK